MADSATIKAIEATAVHRIQSGQVIVNLCSVAKELVENSIDAGATSIEVRFKNQGLDAVEVQDNGAGIAPANYEGLALKHYTSKLSRYDDLETLQTFGFRGEALSSLCALSDLRVVTCLAGQAPKGTRLDFDSAGRLCGTGVVAAQKGTTVTVERLFGSLPVRRRELERNIKREWGKVISLLNQYACIQTGLKFSVSQQPTKGKRVVLFATRGNASTRDNMINIFGAKTMTALLPLDLTLELALTRDARARLAGASSSVRAIHVHGFVSRPAHGQGRQTPDRQMFFVNGRPCKLPQFAQLFGEVYRTYNASQAPFIFADLQLDTHLYDVNVSPDKQTILLHDQGKMLDALRESLIELFEKQEITVPMAQMAQLPQKIAFSRPARESVSVERQDETETDTQETETQKTESTQTQESQESPAISPPDEPTVRPPSPPSSQASDASEVEQIVPQKRGLLDVARVTVGSRTVSTNILRSAKRQKFGGASRTRSKKSLPSFGGSLTQMFSAAQARKERGTEEEGEEEGESEEEEEEEDDEEGEENGMEEDEEERSDNSEREADESEASDKDMDEEADREDPMEVNVPSHPKSVAVEEEDEEEEEKGQDDNKDKEQDTPESEEARRAQLFLQSGSKKRHETLQLVQTVRTDEAALCQLAASSQQPPPRRRRQQPAAADGAGGGLDDASAAAEAKLALTISKRDFGRMRVVGQFNLGFILAVRTATANEDDEDDEDDKDDELFIIDQHASDEKYNFERLRATTVVQSQRLVRPKQLALTAVEEEIVLAHEGALAANGFAVDIVTDGSRPVGARCRLLTLPLSRETTFDLGDLEELLALLSESGHTDDPDHDDHHRTHDTLPRPGKVRRMLAMRACRSSIMIGRALSHRQMATVLAHMGEMDKPWNCPHGRPTMRHLSSLGRTWDGGRMWHEGRLSSAAWAAFLDRRKT